MARKPPFQDWKLAHIAMVVAVMATCAAFFAFTSDANLFVAAGLIMGAGLLAIFGAQLDVWIETRNNDTEQRR